MQVLYYREEEETMQSVSAEENHEQSLQPGPSNVDAIQPSASKRASKKYTSPIWNYFEKVHALILLVV